MIRIAIYRRNNDLTLQLTGHADSAPIGQDIVCASASILAYTYAQRAMTMQRNGLLARKAVIKLDEGNALVTIRPKQETMADALSTLITIQTGYQLLAKDYPEYINLIGCISQE